MEENTCTICLDNLQPNDLVILLVGCGHFQFHSTCARHWFKNGQKSCPVCRDKSIKDHIFTMPLKKAIEQNKKRKETKSNKVIAPNDQQEYQTRQNNVQIRIENITIQGNVGTFQIGSGNVIEIV